MTDEAFLTLFKNWDRVFFHICPEDEMDSDFKAIILAFKDSYIRILDCAEKLDSVERKELLYNLTLVIGNMMVISNKISPAFPEVLSAARRVNIETVRPKRPATDEVKIENALKPWDGRDESLYKFTLAASAELKTQGVKIGAKALRERAKKTAVVCWTKAVV